MRFTFLVVLIVGTGLGCQTDVDHTHLGFKATHMVLAGSEFAVLGSKDIAMVGADAEVRSSRSIAESNWSWSLAFNGSGLSRLRHSEDTGLLLERFNLELEPLDNVRLADFAPLRQSVYFNGEEYLVMLRGDSEFLVSRFDATGEAIESHQIDFGEIRTDSISLVWNGAGYYAIVVAYYDLWLLELDAKAAPVGQPRRLFEEVGLGDESAPHPQIIWTGDEIVGVLEWGYSGDESDVGSEALWFFRLNPTTGNVVTNSIPNIADCASKTLQKTNDGYVVATFTSSEILRLDPDGVLLAKERVVGSGAYPNISRLEWTPTGLAVLYADYDARLGRRTSHFYFAAP